MKKSPTDICLGSLVIFGWVPSEIEKLGFAIGCSRAKINEEGLPVEFWVFSLVGLRHHAFG